MKMNKYNNEGILKGKRSKQMEDKVLEESRLPKIAIIGRPNVGKSTLFNRLARYKHAIVYSTPGVTRDRLDKVIDYEGFKFVLMDTGGFTVEDDDSFKSHIRRQGESAFNEADVVIFLVDIDGVTRDDFAVAQMLRKSSKKVVLTLNKVDNDKRLEFVNEFYELGFGEAVPISAEHGRNIYDLVEKIKTKLPENLISTYDDFDEYDGNKNPNEIRVSIIGKPNSGKSSLLNRLLGYERSIVTNVPGTTRDSVEESITYKGKTIKFMDTAGLRRRSKVETKGIEYASVQRSIDSIKRSEVVLLLIDSMENITQQDKKIASVAVNNNKALILVVNKWDLMRGESKSYKEYKEWIRFRFSVANYIPIINISALEGTGINKMLNLIGIIHKEYHKRIETSVLKQWIEIITANHIPSGKKGTLKIFYGTQIKSAPPTFLFFVNNKDLIIDSYEKYLTNNLREAFGFSGVPLKISFKNR